MYKRIDFTKLGGLATYQDTLDFLQTSYRDAISAIAKGFGSKVIVTGVTDLGSTYSDGWVVIDGELMPFDGGFKNPRVVVNEVSGTELFDDGSTQTVYFTRRATTGVTGGYAFTDFIRIDALSSISEGLKNLVIAHNNLQVAFNAYIPRPEWNDIKNKPASFNPSYHQHNWGEIIPGSMPALVKAIWKDSYAVGDVWGTTDVRTIYHNAGRSDYIIAGDMVSLSSPINDNDVVWVVKNKTSTSFQLLLNELGSNPPTQSLRFDYMLIALL